MVNLNDFCNSKRAKERDLGRGREQKEVAEGIWEGEREVGVLMGRDVGEGERRVL